MTPENHVFSGIGVITAEVPGQQKIDCVITMKGYTSVKGAATVTSTSVAAVLDPTCENAQMGPGAILIRPQTRQGGYVTHFKIFMPSGVDCGMAAQLPFTLDDAGHFVVNATLPSKAGPMRCLHRNSIRLPLDLAFQVIAAQLIGRPGPGPGPVPGPEAGRRLGWTGGVSPIRTILAGLRAAHSRSRARRPPPRARRDFFIPPHEGEGQNKKHVSLDETEREHAMGSGMDGAGPFPLLPPPFADWFG